MVSPGFRNPRFRMHPLLAAVVAAALLWSAPPAHAQGCLAAHANQRMMDELCTSSSEQSSGHSSGERADWIHNRLTVNLGFRTYSSFRHFVGTEEQVQRQIQHTQVENHQNIWNIGIEYRLNPRWSLIADVPVLQSSRNRPRNNPSFVTGVGDMTIGAQAWLFRPPTESGANAALSVALKIPTGVYNGLAPDGTTADQSIQPGDGGWGFNLGAQAYKPIWFRSTAYFEGSYTFNPRNTNGVPTYRRAAGEGVMSVADVYLLRGGVSRGVPKLRNLALSFGGRMEGVPVRDAFGGSDGFRRPGYVISIDPGLMFSLGRSTLSVNAPWAMERNRRRNTADIQYGKHGDAAFADYTILVGLSHRF
jgi:hypothetical protein